MAATPLSSKTVSASATAESMMPGIVAAMVTRRRVPISKPPQVRRVRLFLREWRKFMGVSAVVCADALDIERESYLRLEREPWRINLEELEIIAESIGVKSSQLRFPPPQDGSERISLDEMIEDAPEAVQKMAIAAIRGMVGK
jgi:transcriptional regulator with XRE-family HTH domain